MQDFYEIDEKTKEMWEKFDYIENNEKCDCSNDYTLVHINPEAPEFICIKCGKTKEFDLKKIKLENK